MADAGELAKGNGTQKRKREWSERTCLDESPNGRTNGKTDRQTYGLANERSLRYASGLRGISLRVAAIKA